MSIEVDYIPLSLYKYIVAEAVSERTIPTVYVNSKESRIDNRKYISIRMRFPNYRGMAILIETETSTIIFEDGAEDHFDEYVNTIMICPLIYTGDGASDCHYVYQKVTSRYQHETGDSDPYTYDQVVCAGLPISNPDHTRYMIAYEAHYIITQPNPGCEKCKAFWWYQIGKSAAGVES